MYNPIKYYTRVTCWKKEGTALPLQAVAGGVWGFLRQTQTQKTHRLTPSSPVQPVLTHPIATVLRFSQQSIFIHFVHLVFSLLVFVLLLALLFCFSTCAFGKRLNKALPKIVPKLHLNA